MLLSPCAMLLGRTRAFHHRQSGWACRLSVCLAVCCCSALPQQPALSAWAGLLWAAFQWRGRRAPGSFQALERGVRFIWAWHGNMWYKNSKQGIKIHVISWSQFIVPGFQRKWCSSEMEQLISSAGLSVQGQFIQTVHRPVWGKTMWQCRCVYERRPGRRWRPRGGEVVPPSLTLTDILARSTSRNKERKVVFFVFSPSTWWCAAADTGRGRAAYPAAQFPCYLSHCFFLLPIYRHAVQLGRHKRVWHAVKPPKNKPRLRKGLTSSYPTHWLFQNRHRRWVFTHLCTVRLHGHLPPVLPKPHKTTPSPSDAIFSFFISRWIKTPLEMRANIILHECNANRLCVWMQSVTG